MAINTHDPRREPSRAEVDAMRGPVVIEFGTPWCGHCIAIQEDLRAVMASYPQVRHLKVEDGRGRPLGRSFGVKLWPTFVFLKDGEVRHRAVRPTAEELREGFERVAGAGAEPPALAP